MPELQNSNTEWRVTLAAPGQECASLVWIGDLEASAWNAYRREVERFVDSDVVVAIERRSVSQWENADA